MSIKVYLFIINLQIRSFNNEGGVILPGLQLLKEVDEGPEHEAMVLVHGAPAPHLLQDKVTLFTIQYSKTFGKPIVANAHAQLVF